eukprot:CAMPEP_0118978498 /NCGR_PEP_ID=MMETSP1173-20130426/23825_1 /TAXON_ID=1034831 /ORGANISM="Rhizochromulina marina cf, Strain CCMP1243" /LENGTH=161 /DNA_ID=CAMNT_0006928695 /DNA_START=252 /DNA_END=737 /DNA_ORIENTATION=-
MMHMALELERLFEGNAIPGKIVWLVDFRGFGLRDCNPRMGMTTVPMFSNHYPERMGQIILFDPPMVFHTMYRAIQAILDPVTKAKIKIVKGSVSLMRFVENEVQHDPGMQKWLQTVYECPPVPGCFPPLEASNELCEDFARRHLARVHEMVRNGGTGTSRL